MEHLPQSAAAAFADLPPEIRARLNEQSWEKWVKFYFPKPFSRPFTSYQREFWEWGWRILPDRYYRPRVECEPRGVGKSTNAEVLTVSLLARKRKQAIGYVSGTDDKATKHFNSIKRKLESESLLRDYPHLKPKVQKYRNAFNGWSQDRLITEGGQMIIPITLQGSNRGFKSEDDTRFDLIVLDDIDSLGESPDVVMKNIELLKSEILLAGYANTTILFPQNLIYRDSICSMVLDHRADMLTDREFVGPFPMMKWYDAEKMDLPGGGKRWVITAGEVFDEAIPLEYCESVLNQIGKDLFDRECQQDVSKVGDDKDFREWNEVYHVITQSEMVAGFPKVQMKDANGFFIPSRWHVGRGFDWGSTRAHPSSVASVTRPDKTCPNDDSHFFFSEVILPTFPYDPSIAAEVVSPGRVAAAVKMAHQRFRIRDAQIEQSKMSHEASAAQSTLMLDLPEELQMFFKKWKAAKGSGVPQIQNLMEIDHTKPHPFRKHPATGKPIMGRPRFYLVVEDGQGELYLDGNGKLRVAGARDSGGQARARYEIPLYSHRNSGQKKIDDDWCFVAGTLIQTERGNVPIEEIQVGDLIQTRYGLFPVLSSLVTHEAEIWRLELSDGRWLEGTANHPIYTKNRGFIRLDSLRGNDMLWVWENEPTTHEKAKWSSLTVSDTTDTLMPVNVATKFTFKPTMPLGSLDSPLITLTYGDQYAEKFLRAMKSTIETATLLTTTSPTWSVCPSRSIVTTTERTRQPSANENTWNQFVRWLLSGTGAKKVESGIARMERRLGRLARRQRSRIGSLAWSVYSRLRRICRSLNAVQASVKNVPAIASVFPTGKQNSVYNLTVSECPEYFANGILVHNCDSARGIMATFGVESDKLTQSEQLDALIPEKYKPETLKENYTYEREMSVNYQMAQAKKKLEPEVFIFNEALEPETDVWQ